MSGFYRSAPTPQTRTATIFVGKLPPSWYTVVVKVEDGGPISYIHSSDTGETYRVYESGGSHAEERTLSLYFVIEGS